MNDRRATDDGHVIEGVTALLFTPFTADARAFDGESMRRQIDRALDSGVSAVVACGKAGEFEGLELSEVEEVLRFAVEHIDGRVPIGTGIISVDGDEGLCAADVAARCGVDFAMVKKRSPAGLRDFFLQVVERVPVMLYDMTDQGGLDVDAEILPLVDECERIVALKVSSNVYSFGQLRAAVPHVPLSCGWDAFSPMAYLSGADGVVAGSASVMPRQEVELHRLAKNGQWDEARTLFYERMLPLITYATPDPYAFSVCKHLLHWNGIFDSAVVRRPYEPVPPWMADEIRVLAQRLELVD